jgi:glycosyltransferase involved in cell wall biosynthesis
MPAIDAVDPAEKRPFWSVMIPCFNSADLLAATLASVLEQDPGPDDMQIEVVDDASTLDDPAEVVARLGGGRVGFFRQPFNLGPQANFTACVRRSTGKWVHILHSDDLVMPGFYDCYQRQIERNPAAEMVAGQTITIDAEGRYLSVTRPVATVDGYVNDAGVVIATTNPIRCVAVVIARHAYEAAGGFHPDLVHANDWEMWSRMANRGPVAWVDRPLGLYRSHADSDSTRLRRRTTVYIDDCLRAADIIAGHFHDPGVRKRVRQGARGDVCDTAIVIGLTLVEGGWFRLGLSNAARAVVIQPSVHSVARAVEVAHLATVRRLAVATSRRRQPPQR